MFFKSLFVNVIIYLHDIILNNKDIKVKYQYWRAGVFTENFRDGLRCANEIEAGTVFVNKQSTFRTDNMPFGGFKNSGTGKEGVKYAVEEMTKEKLIGLNLR